MDLAVKAARQAFNHGSWPRMPGTVRIFSYLPPSLSPSFSVLCTALCPSLSLSSLYRYLPTLSFSPSSVNRFFSTLSLSLSILQAGIRSPPPFLSFQKRKMFKIKFADSSLSLSLSWPSISLNSGKKEDHAKIRRPNRPACRRTSTTRRPRLRKTLQSSPIHRTPHVLRASPILRRSSRQDPRRDPQDVKRSSSLHLEGTHWSCRPHNSLELAFPHFLLQGRPCLSRWLHHGRQARRAVPSLLSLLRSSLQKGAPSNLTLFPTKTLNPGCRLGFRMACSTLLLVLGLLLVLLLALTWTSIK